MSMDPSLKVATNMSSKRSVLKREERVAKLQADKKFDTSKDRVLGLAKTLVGKS